MTEETTTNADIREKAPEGMVSTREFLDTVLEFSPRFNWCETAQRYIEQNTPIKFEVRKRSWNDEQDRYDFEPPYLTPASDSPEFVSHKDIQRAARAALRGHPYDSKIGVPELLEHFGVELVEFTDTWTVTATVTSQDLAKHSGFLLDEEEEEPFRVLSYIRDAVYGLFDDDIDRLEYDGERAPKVKVDYQPDPRRTTE